MKDLLEIWRTAEPKKRLVFGLGVVAVVIAMIGLVSAARKPDMALLYSGLEAEAAGEVITALEGRTIPFDVRGDSIYVTADQRDSLRLELAAEGLPQSSVKGYELLDSLNGFGTTSQMFDAAYWRAKEGELARTILSAPSIRAARVHIAQGDAGSFGRRAEPTASVTVTSMSGTMSREKARALRYLVASAVADLDPENVSVIDSESGIILAAGEGGASGAGDLTPESRALKMKANVERLLAARLGPGRAIVEVNVDANMDAETISERVIDPESRIAISTDTEATNESSRGQDSGVTVASNLPDGNGADGASSSQTAETSRERVNYELSETRRERVRAPGEIERLTVAVMVDGERAVDDAGDMSWTPLEQAELDRLSTLIKSAIGYDESRGDVVTIESMEFDLPAGSEAVAGTGVLAGLMPNLSSLIRTGLLSLVVIVLALTVLRPFLTRRPQQLAIEPAPVETGPDQVEEVINKTSDILPLDFDDKSSDQINRLKQIVDQRADDSARVLSGWISESRA
ncbi:flagellar basal-body MS-ring/collar protein FliF [Paracoccaceae bacterium GXU_MW_L88]